MAHDPRTSESLPGHSEPDLDVPPGLVPATIDDDDPRKRQIKRRPDTSVVVVSLILILAIAVLLAMQRCSNAQNGFNSSGGTSSIADVPAAQRDSGAISVWVKDGEDPSKVLQRYGIPVASITVVGSDKAIGRVPEGTATKLVESLKLDQAVQDAGYVMSTPSSTSPLPPMATP